MAVLAQPIAAIWAFIELVDSKHEASVKLFRSPWRRNSEVSWMNVNLQ